MIQQPQKFDVIIIGGSYAGLSAAMSLGRALRKILIIDSGIPCNRFTPYAHNFITHDGQSPLEIAGRAKAQVLKYDTICWKDDEVLAVRGKHNDFSVKTRSGAVFSASKILFSTGVKDIMPAVTGFGACWGVSVLHCPYCHGYEARGQKTGILMNGDGAFDLSKMIRYWTDNLTILTNGKSEISPEQLRILKQHDIAIIEKEIVSFDHEAGQLRQINFKDGSKTEFKVLYARPAFEQHLDAPQKLGCAMTDDGFIRVDELKRTTVPGIYAAGDNTSQFRSLAAVIAAGNIAGAMLNREMVEETFASDFIK